MEALAFIEAKGLYAIVPVPPRPGKIKRKGWDQIELLARRMERSGVSVSRCLRRLPSRSQKELDRHGRAINLVGKMICIEPPPKTAILIDDVITTGSTMDACARALKEAGCAHVYALAFCYD
jgi:predicted amidophosphoribosyltransferase